ncbi:MAG: DNA translocase FtsK 4TM domain-containing protein [Endozoicomonas sp. (ex Botrylloides leachii)]|nr:DNA translocase FtsK 4TM domain-containing protein [Endozoicomonas sp. (ex Botrylloides leachii)]
MRLREGLMLFMGLLSGYLFISLYSYAPNDPGWQYIGSTSIISNSGGRAGAWLADWLYGLVGFFAWFLPVVIFFQGVWVFRNRYHLWRCQPWHALIKMVSFFLALCCGSALASLHYPFGGDNLPASSGGMMGMLISSKCLAIFNKVGSTLILGALFLIGLTLCTAISWFKIINLIGRVTSLMLGVLENKCLDLYRALPSWHFFIRQQYQCYRDGFKTKKPLPLAQRVMPKLKAQLTGVVPLAKTMGETELNIQAMKKKQRQPIETRISVVHRYPDAVDLLDKVTHSSSGISESSMAWVSRQLELKLKDFGVEVKVVAVQPGPVITRYEINPAPGIKASRITSLASDLARSLAVVSVRVVEVIPGKSVMGIEIPNEDRKTVFFSELITSSQFELSSSPLSLALGHGISGLPIIVDLSKMPHLLVAGTTGSGKSVGVNAMLLSMLFKAGPDQVRMIMIDPKMLELSIYKGIPHLLAPVVTDMKEAANALRWCVSEMERRYKLMAAMGVRNLAGYNKKILAGIEKGEPITDPFYELLPNEGPPPELTTLPFIVVVIDEFADMMMIVGKKVEELIARIAQKARAAGIHLILATQRPSVDVITGLIKANVPTRISFQVSSKVDSRTIIDQGGAEQLLGHGDMLYLPPGTSMPIRVHGAFVSDGEVHRVVADWKQRGEPCYIDDVLNGAQSSVEGSALTGGLDADSEQDPLYDEAVAFIAETRRASISFIQRKLKIGYNRAARIIEAMESAGVVTPMGSNGNREVIVPPPVKD